MSLGPGEIILIVVLGLLLFGPDKLPEIARELGKYYRQVETSLRKLQEAIMAPIEEGEVREVMEVAKKLEDSASRRNLEG